jgi:hypothetical protein
MENLNQKDGVRDLRDGSWYWINKRVLYLYGQRLKSSGIAVYNVLASFVDSLTQQCFPTHKSIAKLLGLSRRTVIRKINLLEQLGLIRVEKGKSYCFYFLLEPPSDVTNEIQRCDKRDTTPVTGGNTNNNHITRINNNIVNDNKNFLDLKFNAFKGEFRPKTREELLALDLAQALKDRKSLHFYHQLAKNYPESLLRRVLGEVKEIPIERIKKSRGALFNHLIKKYNHSDKFSLL